MVLGMSAKPRPSTGSSRQTFQRLFFTHKFRFRPRWRPPSARISLITSFLVNLALERCVRTNVPAVLLQPQTESPALLSPGAKLCQSQASIAPEICAKPCHDGCSRVVLHISFCVKLRRCLGCLRNDVQEIARSCVPAFGLHARLSLGHRLHLRSVRSRIPAAVLHVILCLRLWDVWDGCETAFSRASSRQFEPQASIFSRLHFGLSHEHRWPPASRSNVRAFVFHTGMNLRLVH